MRALILVALGLLLAGVEGAAREESPSLYKVEIDREHTFSTFRETAGQRGVYVTVPFKLRRSDDAVVTDVGKDEIVVKEDGRPVATLEVYQPRTHNLTTVLALDISGSMSSSGKMAEARRAALTYLDKLDSKSDTGLILFDHELRLREPPSGDPARFVEHRTRLRTAIDAARPGGGTAYLDATAEAVRMLKLVGGRKAVLLLTDGVDMNSKRSLEDVINEARALEVPVYTLGIGEPGLNEPVTTVLVLDQSGSMRAKASDKDAGTKIEALRLAASRFVDLMRPKGQTTLLPFSDTIDLPRPFSDDKAALKERVKLLQPQGGTLLYDATYEGIETVLAARRPGKKAVVVLTDGKDEDPGSRRSDRDVIARARGAGVPLYMLGLGRAREINEAVMKRMAKETGGEYYHAANQQKLFEIFEKLSIDLHDDGIDEESLQRLASETGGKYIPARDISRLGLIFGELAEELQSTYTVTFKSLRPTNDGTARAIEVSIRRNGVVVSEGGAVDYAVHGVVVPEMDARVYLSLLSLIGVLLALPTGLRGLYRFYGGR